jgi:molybdenum cofactor cytidylyltransferase
MSRSKVSGVILAAGPSRRFGEDPPKQLALFRGEPLVRRTAKLALRSELAEVIVVVGLRAAEVTETIADLAVRIVENPRFTEGQSTSVTTGLEAVANDMEAAMFIPIDQPQLTTEVVALLLDRYRLGEAGIIVPTSEGQRGAPVLFDQSMFGPLARIQGDAGGRQLLGSYRDSVVEVPISTGGPLLDVDTPEDLHSMES